MHYGCVCVSSIRQPLQSNIFLIEAICSCSDLISGVRQQFGPMNMHRFELFRRFLEGIKETIDQVLCLLLCIGKKDISFPTFVMHASVWTDGVDIYFPGAFVRRTRCDVSGRSICEASKSFPSRAFVRCTNGDIRGIRRSFRGAGMLTRNVCFLTQPSLFENDSYQMHITLIKFFSNVSKHGHLIPFHFLMISKLVPWRLTTSTSLAPG